jgi:hypothetical protein
MNAEGDRPAFASDYPGLGVYGLWVEFSYRGRVRTAAFSQEVVR